MKRTIYSILSLIFLGSSITLFGMYNGIPLPDFSALDEEREEGQATPIGSDTEDDISPLRAQFITLLQQLNNATNPNERATVLAALERLRDEATRQQLDQQLVYDINQFLPQ